MPPGRHSETLETIPDLEKRHQPGGRSVPERQVVKLDPTTTITTTAAA